MKDIKLNNSIGEEVAKTKVAEGTKVVNAATVGADNLAKATTSANLAKAATADKLAKTTTAANLAKATTSTGVA